MEKLTVSTPKSSKVSGSKSERLWTEGNMLDNDVDKIPYDDFISDYPKLASNSSMFSAILRELDQAHKSDANELTTDEMKILFRDKIHVDYLLSAHFKKRIKSIPADGEAEWIYMMWARLFEAFYELYVYDENGDLVRMHNVVVRSNKLRSPGGLIPDRAFGFALFDEPDVASEYKQERAMPEFMTKGIRFPMIMTAIKSFSLHDQKENNDFYKLAILEGLAHDHQKNIIDKVNEEFSGYTIRLPLVFGIHAIGHLVRISVHQAINGQKMSIFFKELDYLHHSIQVLKTFAIIKRVLLKVHQSVGKATKYMAKVNITNDDSVDLIDEQESSSRKEQKMSSTTSRTNISMNKKLLEPTEQTTIYENDRTLVTVGILPGEVPQRVVLKTTLRGDGLREALILKKLQGLQEDRTVPCLIGMDDKGKNRVALTLSYHDGSHPHYSQFNSVNEFKAFAVKLIQAVNCLHQKGLIHNDLKERNIIWCAKNQKITLIDFAGATTVFEQRQIFTQGYQAPEATATPKSDVYSLGIIFINLLFGVSIKHHCQVKDFHACSKPTELDIWLKKEFSQHKTVQSFGFAAHSLLVKMTCTDPDFRIVTSAILKHSFLN